MALTTRFGIEIPDVGLDSDMWGNILNNYFNALEPLIFDKRGDIVNGNLTVTGSTSVTTLAATGALTLTGGTANGVAYLNGSKVLTTGSALTFNGSSLNVVVANGTNPRIGARFNASNARIGFGIGNSNGYAYLGYNVNDTVGSDSQTYDIAGQRVAQMRMDSGTFIWSRADAGTPGATVSWDEQMRLTSTGLGIGTSSPIGRLDVRTVTGARVIAGRTANSGAGSEVGYFNTYAPNASGTDIVWSEIRTLVNDATAGSEDSSLLFVNRTNGSFTEKLHLNSSGNLGLGVTPSAWQSTFKALQFGTNAGVVANNAFWTGTNFYFDSVGTATYITADFATGHQQFDGQHRFHTAPSGTAGAPISFTQAMTLTQGGNLLVGRTSSSGAPYIIEANSVSDTRFGLSVNGSLTASLQAITNQLNLDVNGAAGFITLATNGAERARITSAGNLLVGTTVDAGARLAVNGPGGLTVSNSGDSSNPRIVFMPVSGGPQLITPYGDGDPSEQQLAFASGVDGTERARITSVGNLRPGADNAYSLGEPSFRWSVVYAATGTINTSDVRAKLDFAPSFGLEFINALEPVSYRYKNGKTVIDQIEDGVEDVPAVLDEEGNEVTPATTKPKFKSVERVIEGQRRHQGLKAQQVKSVLEAQGLGDFAGWVMNDPSDAESGQGLRYDQFIAPLIRAVQEQQAMIVELQSRLAALEAK